MTECYTNYTVSRYDWYPKDAPTGVCVGFTAKCTPNNRSDYWDTIVASGAAQGKTETEIIGLAWDTLSGTVVPWGEIEMHKSSLIGEVFESISGSM